ncbi:MAG: DUF2877 domain-containing protein [Clostridiales bacterium]|nr:DUF2877 domain-containing protein [Clostridiales bacterium]
MEALRITDRLRDYIKGHKGEIGQIHSVFDGAFNIIDSKGRLIGILSTDKDLSPLSMIVNCQSFNHKSIVQGHLCEFTEDAIHFQNSKLKINTSNPKVISLSLSDIQNKRHDISESKLNHLKNIIISDGSLAGISELIKYIEIKDVASYMDLKSAEINEYSDFIKDRLLDLINTILNENIELFKSAIQKTVGFGPGLTPSTDDFLTGIITIMNSLNPTEIEDLLNDINILCAGKTTKISEEMIRHATLGYVPESYKYFIEILFDNNKDDITEAVHKVIQIGSSSGTDFLFGVYCMAMINTEKLRRL